MIKINIANNLQEIAESQLYERGFGLIKHNYEDIPNMMGTLAYQKAILNISDFGIDFLTVCIDND